MAKSFPEGFPGTGTSGDHAPAAQNPFEPGTSPVDASGASEVPLPFDELGLPTIPMDEGLLPSQFDEENEFSGETPDFLEGLF